MQKRFRTYLQKELRYSEHTTIAYCKDVEQFFELSSIDVKDYHLVSTKDARVFIMTLMDAGLNPKSVNRKISALKKFYRFCMIQDGVNKNPFATIKNVKTDKSIPNFVREEDMIKMDELNDLFPDNLMGLRDRLMVELFYQTGIRRAELINLKQSDCSNESIKVLGKRNKERIIPVSKELIELKEKYLSERESNTEDHEYLLLTDKGNKLYPKFVYRKINHYIGEVSRLKKKSPHVLRHSFATHMLNNGAGIETIKEILGHESLVATQVYTHNSFEKLKSIYKQAHPRG